MLVNFKNVILPNFLLKENAVPFLFQEKCNYIQMQKVLINFLNNIEIKNKIYESYSKNILKNMSYLNSKSTNFTINSGKMVINLINNYKR
jgi:lipid A disaccharide synthetase